MSTAALTSLLDYLTATLSKSNKQWLADHLYQQVREEQQVTPYTMEEIDAMLDRAEADIAAGRVMSRKEISDKMMKYISQYA